MKQATVPAHESRRARFERIGTKRMNRAIHEIELLGNLARPRYAWEEHDVAEIERVLTHILGETLAKFKRRHKRRARRAKGEGFSFSSH